MNDPLPDSSKVFGKTSAEAALQPACTRPDTHWAFSPLDHGRCNLGNLEDAISQDDSVRWFAEILAAFDWREWEAHYPGKRGRPPIHPRILAGVLLFGIFREIRSSRRLAEACEYRLDFRWLAGGLRHDHCTLSEFRRSFPQQLKDLFRQVNRYPMEQKEEKEDMRCVIARWLRG